MTSEPTKAAEAGITGDANEAAHNNTNSLTKTGSANDHPPISTAPLASQLGPPPNGGLTAWLQSIAGHLVCINVWGYIVSFGVFQPYYVETLNLPPSTISWIGSIQLFLVNFCAAVSGRLYDAGYLKPLMLVGCLLQVVGIFMSSIAKEYYQFFLSQGVCMGIGFGLTFAPVIGNVSTFFSTRKTVAMAISATGGATGGIIYPLIAQQLLPRVGFAWSVRTMGLVMLVNSIIIILIVRSRLPARKGGALVDWAAYRELPFIFYNVAAFFIMWATYFAFYYARAYVKDQLGGTQSQSFIVLMIMNAAGIPGRMVPAFIADRYIGPLNTYIPQSLATAVCIFAWHAVDSITGTYIFVAFIGYSAAGLMSLLPAATAALTDDMSKVGTRIGMILTLVSVPSLTGSPLAGKLIQSADGDYLGAQIWGGCCMLLGCGFLCAASWAKRRDTRRAAVAES